MRVIVTWCCVFMSLGVMGMESSDSLSTLDDGMRTPVKGFSETTDRKKLKQELDIQDSHFQSDLLLDKVNELLDGGVNPEGICAIFDLDGTLTMDEYPPENAIISKPRDEVIEFLLSLKEKNICVLLSSAWDDFGRILKTLEEIGLKDLLCGQAEKGKYLLEFNSDQFDVVSQGSVISVSKKGGIKGNIYFYNKFFASVFDALHHKKPFPQYILFFDDKNENIELFQEDCLYSLPECKTKMLITVKI